MDKAEVIERLEYLKAKAQIALEQEVPEWIAEDVLSTIEAYDMATEALRCEPKRGEWIEHEGKTIVMDNNFVDFFPTEYECSNCGLRQATYFINSSLPNFCPNCGADMREREDE